MTEETEMKKIAIIGANDFQNPLILKAKEMGYETHVFAWREGAPGEETADYFYPISIVEREKILEECRRIRPAAVISIGISTNKYAMRTAFSEAGIPTPGFRCVGVAAKAEELEALSLPVIVKPTDRSGSRGVTRLDSWEGFSEAVRNAVENSFEKKAIVEEYLPGEEYSCECISFQGRHQLLAVTKKYTTGAPHFIETGHLEPAQLSEEELETIQTNVFRALDALEILLDKGADMNAADNDGNTVLHFIADSSSRNEAKDALDIMLDYGDVDAEAVNNDGKTALDNAQYWENESLIKLILSLTI